MSGASEGGMADESAQAGKAKSEEVPYKLKHYLTSIDRDRRALNRVVMC